MDALLVTPDVGGQYKLDELRKVPKLVTAGNSVKARQGDPMDGGHMPYGLGTQPDSESNSASDRQSRPKLWTRLSYPSLGPQNMIPPFFTSRARVLTPPARTYAYKADNPEKMPLQTTMGVEVVVLQSGDGQRPRVGDTVTTHYVGTIVSNGSTFGSSLVRGTPFVTEIGVGKAIKGWDEGVLQLTEGSRAILKVSPDYAYGTRGFPPVIPPNAALEFEVELLGIKRSKTS